MNKQKEKVVMNKWFSGILAAGLVAGLTTGAQAQTGGGAGGGAGTSSPSAMKVDKPWSIKVGGLFYTGDTKDLIGNSTISLGVGYDFVKTKADNPVVVQGYLDYFASKDGDDTKNVGETQVTTNSKLDYVIGVGAAARYQLVRATDTASVFPYVGVGVGIYNAKSKVSSTPPQPNDDSETKTGLGGKIFIGAELKQGFLAELEYNFIPKSSEINPSGLGVRIGYRF